MIDLHCHPLAGIDDGPPTMDDALALVAAAHAAGTGTVVATPHVSLEYPNRADDDRAPRRRAQPSGCARAGVAIEVLTGAEIAMTVLSDIAPRGALAADARGRALAARSSRRSCRCSAASTRSSQRSSAAGFGVVLAHPERCRAFHRDRAMLERLVRSGVLVSITAGSLDGRFGGTVRRFSSDLVRDGLVHNVASDAHDVAGRPPSIAGELERAGLGVVERLAHAGGPRGDRARPRDPAAARRADPGGHRLTLVPAAAARR